MPEQLSLSHQHDHNRPKRTDDGFLRPLRIAVATYRVHAPVVRATARHYLRRFTTLQRRRPVTFLMVALLSLSAVPVISPSSGVGAFFGGVPFLGSDATERAVTSTSRYVHWMTTDTSADVAYADRLGCEAATRGETGPILLAFGRQVDAGGTRGFDGPRVLRPYTQLAAVATGFRDGLARCGGGALLVVTTSNYRLDDVTEAARFGTEWAELVRSIGSRDGVTVAGGTDLEPGWGSLAGAKAWVQSFKASGLTLYSNASADGCPRSGHGGPCANSWNTSALAELVWGDGGVAIPQIYRHDGAQAEQWGVLARLWADAGGTPRFAGAMTQVRACDQVRNRNCPQLSLAPDGARAQLQQAVGALAEIPVGTDVGWG